MAITILLCPSSACCMESAELQLDWLLVSINQDRCEGLPPLIFRHLYVLLNSLLAMNDNTS